MNANELRKALDEGARTRYEEGSEERDPFRMSAAGDCPRKLVLLANGAPPEPITGKQARIFGHGSLRGREIAADLLHGLGKGWKAECEIEVEYMIAGREVLGHLDVLLTAPNGEKIVVEVKTMNEWAWKRVSEDDPATVGDQYRAQAAMYALASEAQAVFFVCESKNDGNHKVVEIPVRMILEDAERGKMNLAQAIVAHKEGELPAPLPAKEKGELPWNCNYCSVWEACLKTRSDRVVDVGKGDRRKLVLA